MRKLMWLLALLPAIAMANPPMFGEPPCGEMHFPKHHKFADGEQPLPEFLQQIDLTEQQRTEIKNLLKAHRGEFEAKMDQDRTLITESHRLSFSKSFSEEKSLALFDKAYAIHKETALNKAKLDNAIFNLLSEEQQKKLQRKLAQLDN